MANLWEPKSDSLTTWTTPRIHKIFAASFVNETAELGLFITQERNGLPENPWNQES